MLTALKALPLLWRLATVAGVLIALSGTIWGIYAYVKHQGYVEGYSDASAKCEAEKRAMEEANRKAISDAEKKLIEAEQGITDLEIKLEDYTNAIDLLADQGPDAGGICLFAPSMRRLSQF